MNGESDPAQSAVPAAAKKARPLLFKVAIALWMAIVGAVSVLIAAACIYFAWEEGWIGFMPKVVILAVAALILAAVVEFLRR